MVKTISTGIAAVGCGTNIVETDLARMQENSKLKRST